MFDLSARLLIQDAFSGALDHLFDKTDQATDALLALGSSADASTKSAMVHMQELEATLSRLSAKAQSGKDLSLLDVNQFRVAERSLNSYRSTLIDMGASGVKVADKLGITTLAVEGLDDVVTKTTRGGALNFGQLGMAASMVLPQFGALGGVAGLLAGPAGLVGLGAAAVGIGWSLGTAGIAAERAEKKFAAFAGGAELASDDLNLMRMATEGALSSQQAMTTATQLLSMGLAKSGEDAAQLTRMAIMLGPAWEDSAAAVADFSMMLSNMSVERLDQFGISSGQVRRRIEELQAANKSLTSDMAFSQAVLEVGAAKMRVLESSGLAAGTSTQQLSAHFADLKDTLAKGLAPAVDGATQRLLLLLKLGNVFFGTGKDVQVDKLQALKLMLQDLERQRANLTAGAVPTTIPAISGIGALLGLGLAEAGKQTGALDQQIAAVKEEIAGLEAGLKAAAEAALKYGQSSDVVMGVLKREEETASVTLKVWQAYTAAQQGGGDTALMLAQQAGAATGQLQQLAIAAKGVPKLPTNLLEFNPGPLRQWIDGLGDLDTNLRGVETDMLRTVDTTENAQQAVLKAALAANTGAEGLQILARAAGLADGSVVGLLEQFDKFPASVQAAIGQLGGLSAAIGELNAKANAPVDVGVAVQGLEGALNEIDQIAKSMIGIMDPAQIVQFRERARSDVEQHWLKMGNISRFSMDLILGIELAGYQRLADNQRTAYAKSEADATKHAALMGRTAQELQSSMEAAFKGGLQVTDVQMLQTKAGVYQNVAMENARRLDAIAQRGMEEIKAHPDWVNILKIPPEVLAQGETALKAWAAQTRDDVENLVRPDLIDWEGFGREWDKQQERAAAKSLTLSMGVEFLTKTGRLGNMSPEAAQKKVAEMLGLSNPSITFDALLKADPATYGPTISTWLGGKDKAPIPAELVFPHMTPEQLLASLGLTGPLQVKVEPLFPAGVMPKNPSTQPGYVLPNGAPAKQPSMLPEQQYLLPNGAVPKLPSTLPEQMAADLGTGYGKALAMVNFGGLTAQSMHESFTASGSLFDLVAQEAGIKISQALVKGMDEGLTPDLLSLLARKILPEVGRMLNLGRGAYALDGVCR